jgi:hypothetical protein
VICLHLWPPPNPNSPTGAQAKPKSGSGYAGGSRSLRRLASKEACDQALSEDGTTIYLQEDRIIPPGDGARAYMHLLSSFSRCFQPSLTMGAIYKVLVRVEIRLSDYAQLPVQCRSPAVISTVQRLQHAGQLQLARHLESDLQHPMPPFHVAAPPATPVLEVCSFNGVLRYTRKGSQGTSLTLTHGGMNLRYYGNWKIYSIRAVSSELA